MSVHANESNAIMQLSARCPCRLPHSIVHGSDNEEPRVDQNVIAPFSECRFQALDFFCSHGWRWINGHMRVFVFVVGAGNFDPRLWG
jgi:hypothetical protein